MNGSEHIPVNEPRLEGRELEYVTEAVNSGWVSSTGHFIEDFEDAWARYCGRRHGVAVSNGTAALQLAIACLDLKPGDEVIIPSFTIISCALAVVYSGARPVLVDADPLTWGADPKQIAERITSRTKAIMPVHIYGHPLDMDSILSISDDTGALVIEDAAEAHGAAYLTQRKGGMWARCGGFGVMSCFSFYANKLVTTGEGGMVLTDDESYATKARSLRNLAFQSDRRFFHEDLGFNFRMTNLQAALGLAQVERIDRIVERKREVGKRYLNQLSHLQDRLQLPFEQPWARSVWWMFGIVVSEETGLSGEDLSKRLKERGIETRPFFLGMHEQPIFREMGLFRDESFPITERISRQGIYLPSGLALTNEQVDRVCAALEDVLT